MTNNIRGYSIAKRGLTNLYSCQLWLVILIAYTYPLRYTLRLTTTSICPMLAVDIYFLKCKVPTSTRVGRLVEFGLTSPLAESILSGRTYLTDRV